DPYWDGGIYSNTPIEAVLDDKPRRDSLIFAVHMWNPEGPEPETLWQVMGRQKDIQYASRAKSHIARQKQIHHLRHIIRELAKHVPTKTRTSPVVKELASWGCGTTMHIARLNAPRLDGEDQLKIGRASCREGRGQVGRRRRRRHTSSTRDCSSDVCASDLPRAISRGRSRFITCAISSASWQSMFPPKRARRRW